MMHPLSSGGCVLAIAQRPEKLPFARDFLPEGDYLFRNAWVHCHRLNEASP
jgi:hypothetical protein